MLEELIAYVFARCPGVRHYKNNLLNRAGSSEIDVCFWNKRRLGSLDFLPRGLLVIECKNTHRRVSSSAVRVFRTKLVDMGLRNGILVASNGVTGNSDRLNAAHDAIRTAFQVERVRIIVITRSEL
ncbi:MAG TPA: restriction endonuclease, partial [Allosphingosinicella sp.]|nr:restriction endonuclease [Allosphingosinicella sp.]